MAAAKNDFSQGPVWKNIMNQAIPLTIAQLVHVLYNVVDRIYLGHLPGTSSLALTGVGLIFPIVALVTAFCSLFSHGGTPLCSIARGAGDSERAEKIMNYAFSMLVLTGILLTAAGYAFKKPILYLFGASDATYYYANAYLEIYLIGTIFSMISTGMNSFINSQGFPKVGMLTIVIGAVINVILDPVFIFALNMGVRGAAIATVISQVISGVWVLRFLTGKKALLTLKKKYFIPESKILREIVTLGIPGFIMSGTNCLVQVTCNATLKQYGGDMYIGVMTVINSAREIFSLPVSGLSSGAQPVIGFNYGAKKYARVRTGIAFLSIVGVIVTAICWLLVLVFPRQLFSLFSSDPQLIEIGIPSMQIYFFGFIGMSLQYAGQNAFTALGKSTYAIIFSLLRKAVIVFPLTLILPRIGNLGVKDLKIGEWRYLSKEEVKYRFKIDMSHVN